MARALPFAREIFASLDKAPKDMWEHIHRIFQHQRLLCPGTDHRGGVHRGVLLQRHGIQLGPQNQNIIQEGMGSCVPMAAETDFPLTAIW